MEDSSLSENTENRSIHSEMGQEEKKSIPGQLFLNKTFSLRTNGKKGITRSGKTVVGKPTNKKKQPSEEEPRNTEKDKQIQPEHEGQQPETPVALPAEINSLDESPEFQRLFSKVMKKIAKTIIEVGKLEKIKAQLVAVSLESRIRDTINDSPELKDLESKLNSYKISVVDLVKNIEVD